MAPAIIPVFFDFACPWSYAAFHRQRILAREIGVRFVHVPWELSPDTPAHGAPNRHAQPTARLRAFAAEADVEIPRRETVHNTHVALRGLFYARAVGAEEAYLDRMFDAYWKEQRNVADEDALRLVARESGLDEDALVRATQDRAWMPVLDACDAFAEEHEVETTVTYVLPGGAWQALGPLDETRARLQPLVAA